MQSLFENEWEEVCEDFERSKLQEGSIWRGTHLARELAHLLLRDDGDWNEEALSQAPSLLEKNLHSLLPDRHHDIPRENMQLQKLRLLSESTELQRAVKKIHAPEAAPYAASLIRATLRLPQATTVTDGLTRRASLAAFLAPLRQNVGSCFATAPAILIHEEQPLHFFDDLLSLLSVGNMKRIIEGEEHTVPLSSSWGIGDLKRPISLSSLGTNPWKQLASSPGLREAFLATGILRKGSKGKRLLEKILRSSPLFKLEAEPFALITAEKIIQTILQEHFQVQQRDLQEFQMQQEPMPGPLGTIAPKRRGGKRGSIEEFYRAKDLATSAFCALIDIPLLKAWEYTLASLSESKGDFRVWNLYASLGLHPDEPDGIGSAAFEVVQESIERVNEELRAYSQDYDHVVTQAKVIEGKMRNVKSQSEADWTRSEYQMQKHQLNRIAVRIEDAEDRGRKLSSLLNTLFKFYETKFKDYFQEVYDANLHDVGASPYDDTPAGFRLLYKHGRLNPALWTQIHTPGDFISSLSSFFVATEVELSSLPALKGIEKELSQIVSRLILRIKEPRFLESAFRRLASRYQEPLVDRPLENLEKVPRKPWSYISGGTMGTLISCYYHLPKNPTEEKKWVESPTELLAFFLDTLKEMPTIDKVQSLLTFSPTHAYLLKPNWPLFRKGWEDPGHSYTWIRDVFVSPRQQFLDSNVLNLRMLDHLCQLLKKRFPKGVQHAFSRATGNLLTPMTAPEFRDQLLAALRYEKWMQGGAMIRFTEELDSFLFETLPLFPSHMLTKRLRTLFSHLPKEIANKAEKEFPKESVRTPFLGASDLLKEAKALLAKTLKKSKANTNDHETLLRALRLEGFASPEPLLFADTNWVNNVFGFVVNPAGLLDFWRFDFSGTSGRPIPQWRRYLNGSEKAPWGLYNLPGEYEAV